MVKASLTNINHGPPLPSGKKVRNLIGKKSGMAVMMKRTVTNEHLTHQVLQMVHEDWLLLKP